MACTLHVAWDERLTDYHFRPDHPPAPVRVELTMRLARSAGLGGAGARALETDDCAQRPCHGGGSLIATAVPGLSR